MGESVSFKAYLKQDGKEVEVRRFGIDSEVATYYTYLRGKIQSMFPSLKNDKFSVFWKDADNDYISISSDEELIEALTAATEQPFKLYIQCKPSEQRAQGGSTTGQQVHLGIECDSCENIVVGHRFKCVTCPDYDLCSKCEAKGLHSDHFMLRITSPLGSHLSTKFFRKFMGRPHKFFKHGPGPTMNQHAERSEKFRRCPFGRSESLRNCPPPRSAPSVTDMFDFSALMESINSLGMSMASGQREPCAQAQANTSAQASSSTQASGSQPTAPAPEPSQSQASGPQPAQRESSHGAEYMSQIGQAITAFLDPFDGRLHKIKCRKLFKELAKHLLSNLEFRKRAFKYIMNHTENPSSYASQDLKVLRMLELKKDCRPKIKNLKKPLSLIKIHGHGCQGGFGRRHGQRGGNPHAYHGYRSHGNHGRGSLGIFVHGPDRILERLHGPHGNPGHGYHVHGNLGHGPIRILLHGTNRTFEQVHHAHDELRRGEFCGPSRQHRKFSFQCMFDMDHLKDIPEGHNKKRVVSLGGHDSATSSLVVKGCKGQSGVHLIEDDLIVLDDTEPQLIEESNVPVCNQSENAMDINIVQNENAAGVDVSFEVRPKVTETQEAQPSAPTPTPAATQPPSPVATAPPTPAAATKPPTLPGTPTRETSPPTEADDWTILNRDSPTRNVEGAAAMEVDEFRGARPRSIYPELPEAGPTDAVKEEEKRIQEAADRIFSMGFNFELSMLKDLLKKENCDIASVLEKLLSNRK